LLEKTSKAAGKLESFRSNWVIRLDKSWASITPV